MHAVVGVDVGTSSVKAVAVSPAGQLLGSGSRPTPWRTRHHRTYADPGDVISAVLGCVTDALSDTPGPQAAVGVTGMAESGVLLDDRLMPCAPIVAWHDPSGSRAEEELRKLLPGPRFEQLTGQQLTRRLTAVKYRDLRRSAGARAVRGRWMTIPEWIVCHSLGGQPAPELSQWSRTGFLAIDEPRYLEAIADWAGLPWQDYPAPVWAGTPAGAVPGDHDFELLRGAVLTTAGHDHLCAAAGIGAVDDDDVADSWGNGEAILRGRPGLPDVTAALSGGFRVSWHVLPGKHVLLRGLSSGILLRQVLATVDNGAQDRAHLDAQAARIPAGDPALQAALGVRARDADRRSCRSCPAVARGLGGRIRSGPLRDRRPGGLGASPPRRGLRRLAGQPSQSHGSSWPPFPASSSRPSFRRLPPERPASPRGSRSYARRRYLSLGVQLMRAVVVDRSGKVTVETVADRSPAAARSSSRWTAAVSAAPTAILSPGTIRLPSTRSSWP